MCDDPVQSDVDDVEGDAYRRKRGSDGTGLEPYHDVCELLEDADGEPELKPFGSDGDTWRLLEDENEDRIDSLTGVSLGIV